MRQAGIWLSSGVQRARFVLNGRSQAMNGKNPTDGYFRPTGDCTFSVRIVQNTCEQAIQRVMNMNSHNIKSESVVRPETVQIVPERADPRVIKSNLVDVDQLSISEDCDAGSDPYNSTGQHVVIQSKIDLQD
jgi:hypothetical protein